MTRLLILDRDHAPIAEVAIESVEGDAYSGRLVWSQFSPVLTAVLQEQEEVIVQRALGLLDECSRAIDQHRLLIRDASEDRTDPIESLFVSSDGSCCVVRFDQTRPPRPACACCGYLTLPPSAPGSGRTCPVCHWVDEKPDGQRNDLGRRNGVDLQTARENYEAFGAVSPELKRFVRPPLYREEPKFR